MIFYFKDRVPGWSFYIGSVDYGRSFGIFIKIMKHEFHLNLWNKK